MIELFGVAVNRLRQVGHSREVAHSLHLRQVGHSLHLKQGPILYI